MAMLVHPRVWREHRRARAEADWWIRHGFESRYDWRAAELTTPRERRLSARAIRHVLGELSGSKLFGPVPLRAGALRPHVRLLEAIEARLLDTAPVSARGMLVVNELVTSPGSCLYAGVDDVERRLQEILDQLELS